jgi:hypothetical protein
VVLCEKGLCEKGRNFLDGYASRGKEEEDDGEVKKGWRKLRLRSHVMTFAARSKSKGPTRRVE